MSKRTILFIASFVLLSALFTPRTSYPHYDFIFATSSRTNVDYKQLILNVSFAGVLGFIVAQFSKRGFLILGVIGAVLFATMIVIAVINAQTQRRFDAESRARKDEYWAEVLLRSGQFHSAKEQLANAATNWGLAARPGEEKRVKDYANTISDVFDDIPIKPATKLDRWSAFPDASPTATLRRP